VKDNYLLSPIVSDILKMTKLTAQAVPHTFNLFFSSSKSLYNATTYKNVHWSKNNCSLQSL